MAKEKLNFLEQHKQSLEALGFWEEWHRSVVIKQLEKCYKPEIIMEYGIYDLVTNGDKVLVKWYKRLRPLSEEELKHQYGISLKAPKKRLKRGKN